MCLCSWDYMINHNQNKDKNDCFFECFLMNCFSRFFAHFEPNGHIIGRCFYSRVKVKLGWTKYADGWRAILIPCISLLNHWWLYCVCGLTQKALQLPF